MTRSTLFAVALVAASSVVAGCQTRVRDGQYACSGTGRASDCPPDYTCREDPRLPAELRCYASASSGEPGDAEPDAVTLDAGLDASPPDANPRDARPPRDAASDAERDLGVPDDAGFVACPPGVCSLDEQDGCDAGEACDWEAPRRLGCRPAGTPGEFETCNETTPCRAGLTCHGDRGAMRCVRLCCEIGAPCGTRVCVRLTLSREEVGAAGCLIPPGCEPFLPRECATGEQCTPGRFGARCRAIGEAGIGDDCDPVDCAEGLTCAGSPSRCRTLCRVGGEPSCPTGQHCLGLDPFSAAGGCFPDG